MGAPDPQQRRMLARVGVVVLGLIAFRVAGDDRIAAGVLLWLGIIVAGFPVVDRVAAGRAGGTETMQVGFVLLGLGLAAAGAFLALR